MKNPVFTFFIGLLFLFSTLSVRGEERRVQSVNKLNPTTVEALFDDGNRLLFDFYGGNIVRLFMDVSGGLPRSPKANPPTEILVENARRSVGPLFIEETPTGFHLGTSRLSISIEKETGVMTIHNLATNACVTSIYQPCFSESEVEVSFRAEVEDEYFFGGGVQNGRFSHRGKVIAIENQNSWTDGGVASPAPFYWSTKGYGVMFYTFSKGEYDFDSAQTGMVKLTHEVNYLDLFLMVDEGAVALLNDYYQLTGNPILIPKFGFYEGHLNAYNRDYWTESDKGILFEDGKLYTESQKSDTGVKESLNGELNNYQFSARAVVDRYAANDMPLGWVLPNDGYGAGYGQTETLEGNVANLKAFGDYARSRGVEIGLWTQSDLHPKAEVSALLQRDIVREVRDAGVRVLKTDVAWVGAGYSFGLNGVRDVAQIMTYYGNDARPFIISLDGWAGTQRYAGVWSGDQTGGQWEYIRFHIPTYIGSGLSGMPNVTSDMDGIFGGKNLIVNMRDFQWKTFTPMQLNMDGWGANEKYPHALGEPAASVNRLYLKLKSVLMPYTYSIARESVDGKPMIRALFLEEANDYTLGTATQYQFMYGPFFLVAPIYEACEADSTGNDIRHEIYLPEGEWIDYFTGEKYEGGLILNSFNAPYWKLPVFVKAGAIIPMTNPNNNPSQIRREHRIYEIFPGAASTFTEYDDDGTSMAYTRGESTTTTISSQLLRDKLTVTIGATEGTFEGFVKEKSTEFRIRLTERPKQIRLTLGRRKIALKEVFSIEDFESSANVYFYDESPDLNQFATPGSPFETVSIVTTPILRVKTKACDVTADAMTLRLAGTIYKPADLKQKNGEIAAPSNVSVHTENATAYSLKPTWTPVENADFYEIEFNKMRYSNICDTVFTFRDLSPESDYSFRIRSVNKEGASAWADFTARTATNPLASAIHGIEAETSVRNQGGQEIEKLFDFDENSVWHTQWGRGAVPFEMVINLKSINYLDKLEYLPRSDAGNGTLLEGVIYTGMDGLHWERAGSFSWDRSASVKRFIFENQPRARMLKIEIQKGTGDFGSGREIYIFKVEGTESYLPGDINSDGVIDEKDFE